jgi:hypothetical protein
VSSALLDGVCWSLRSKTTLTFSTLGSSARLHAAAVVRYGEPLHGPGPPGNPAAGDGGGPMGCGRAAGDSSSGPGALAFATPSVSPPPPPLLQGLGYSPLVYATLAASYPCDCTKDTVKGAILRWVGWNSTEVGAGPKGEHVCICLTGLAGCNDLNRIPTRDVA